MVSVFFARSPAVAGTSLVVATPFSLAGSRIGVAVCSLRVTSGARSGSGGDFNLPQNLTSTDLHGRSAMASTPDCPPGSRPAPTGYSALPLSSVVPVSLAAERQPTLDPTRSHRPVTGTCPVIHGPGRRSALSRSWRSSWDIGCSGARSKNDVLDHGETACPGGYPRANPRGCPDAR